VVKHWELLPTAARRKVLALIRKTKLPTAPGQTQPALPDPGPAGCPHLPPDNPRGAVKQGLSRVILALAFAGEHLVSVDWLAMLGESVTGEYAARISGS
jgi:hypothetical protein